MKVEIFMTNEKEMSCGEKAISDDYLDIIVKYDGNIESLIEQYGADCYQIIDEENVILYIPVSDFSMCRSLSKYYTLDKLGMPIGPYGKTGLDKSGILYFHAQPYLPLTGKGVIVGIIDSGIDYIHPVFQYENGRSKIMSIWDQTGIGNPPDGFVFGTEYSNEKINEAIKSNDPYSIVPEQDNTGHGTFLAGIAAGVRDGENGFVGAAPDADLIVVKLKEMKKCRALSLGLENNENVYSSIDLAVGIEYIQKKARLLNKPLVIIIGLGSNIGAHSGLMPLELFINKQSELFGTVFTIAAGNESNLGHHYRGQYESSDVYQEVEFNVANDEDSFFCVLYSTSPDYYSIGLTTPAGEFISRIPVRREKYEELEVVIGDTRINVVYLLSPQVIDQQIISLRFFDPIEGIWTLRIFGDFVINGRYDIYLPREGWIKKDTRFIKPDPYTTVTYPSTSQVPISVGAYNHIQGNLYPSSGRGLTTQYKQKPDLVAPGVNVFGPLPNNKYGTMTGTSVAAAITGGAVALLLEWAVVLGKVLALSPQFIKVWLLRGASRKGYMNYPNALWGYGELDLKNSFDIIKDIYFD